MLGDDIITRASMLLPIAKALGHIMRMILLPEWEAFQQPRLCQTLVAIVSCALL